MGQVWEVQRPAKNSRKSVVGVSKCFCPTLATFNGHSPFRNTSFKVFLVVWLFGLLSKISYFFSSLYPCPVFVVQWLPPQNPFIMPPLFFTHWHGGRGATASQWFPANIDPVRDHQAEVDLPFLSLAISLSLLYKCPTYLQSRYPFLSWLNIHSTRYLSHGVSGTALILKDLQSLFLTLHFDRRKRLIAEDNYIRSLSQDKKGRFQHWLRLPGHFPHNAK